MKKLTLSLLRLFTVPLVVFSGCADHAWGATATATALSITLNGHAVTSVASGSAITLSATVKAGSTALKVGQVQFCDAAAAHCSDIHLLGTAQLTSAGTARMKFSPGLGKHTYKAIFLGTNSNTASSSAVSTLAVTGKYSTTTTIAHSGVAGDYKLRGTVTGSGGPVSPAGTVSFADTSKGNGVLGTAQLGTGTRKLVFKTSTTAIAGGELAEADFNGDGKTDIAIACTGSSTNNVTVFLGNGDGTFTQSASPSIAGGPTAVAVGDFNGDGKMDIAVAFFREASLHSGVEILLGNGDGTFTSTYFTLEDFGAFAISVADFNGDGIADLAVANSIGLETDGGIGTVSVLLGNGDGTFDEAGYQLTGYQPNAMTVGDFNGDGKADITVANYEDNALTVLLGNGDGSFTIAPSPATGAGPVFVAAGDFNGDGLADLVVSNYGDNTLTVLLGKSDGTFTQAATLATEAQPGWTAVGDFNADGVADLAVSIYGENTLTVLLGHGDGTFTPTAHPVAGPGSLAFAVGDVNGDGTADLVTESQTELLTQQTWTASAVATGISPKGLGTHEVEASYPGSTVFGSSISSPIALTGVAAVVSLSPSSLDFGEQNVDTESAAKLVTLTNTGTAALSLSSVVLTGAHPGEFLASNDCGATVATGVSCTLRVRFYPRITGTLTAMLTLTDNAGNSPQSIALTGTSVYRPVVSLSATSVAFGSETVGIETAVKTVLLTNPGNEALAINSIALAGAHPAQFLTSNNCGTSLSASASCSIRLRFYPKVKGALTANLTITDNAAGSPQTIVLTGTGQ